MESSCIDKGNNHIRILGQNEKNSCVQVLTPEKKSVGQSGPFAFYFPKALPFSPCVIFVMSKNCKIFRMLGSGQRPRVSWDT